MNRNRCQLIYAIEKNKESLAYLKRLVKRMERWYDNFGEYIPKFGNSITGLVVIINDTENTLKCLIEELESIAS